MATCVANKQVSALLAAHRNKWCMVMSMLRACCFVVLVNAWCIYAILNPIRQVGKAIHCTESCLLAIVPADIRLSQNLPRHASSSKKERFDVRSARCLCTRVSA